MAGKGDLAGFLRGLRLIRQAVVESQGKELGHAWQNSSVKIGHRRPWYEATAGHEWGRAAGSRYSGRLLLSIIS